jgi:hypothetical protein
MMDKIPRMPSVEIRTKTKDMNPWCGVLGCASQSNLAPKDRQEPFLMLLEGVALETLAVTPSSDDGPPAVLLMLVR